MVEEYKNQIKMMEEVRRELISEIEGNLRELYAGITVLDIYYEISDEISIWVELAKGDCFGEIEIPIDYMNNEAFLEELGSL